MEAKPGYLFQQSSSMTSVSKQFVLLRHRQNQDIKDLESFAPSIVKKMELKQKPA